MSAPEPRTAARWLGADSVYEDFCEHGYALDDAAHPSAGLEWCPRCAAEYLRSLDHLDEDRDRPAGAVSREGDA